MKKNILSILILALLVVNIVLTTVMMLTVTGSSKKTAKLVTQIATVLDLELGTPDEEEAAEAIPMEDIATYNLSEEMTILLKSGEDGKAHYCMMQPSLVMNMKDKGFKKYGEAIQETLVQDIIIETVGEYTLEEFTANTDEVKTKIVEKIQAMYDSEFIFNVAFGDYKCQ